MIGLEESHVFVEDFGDEVEGAEMREGGHQAAAAGAQFHGSSSLSRLIL